MSTFFVVVVCLLVAAMGYCFHGLIKANFYCKHWKKILERQAKLDRGEKMMEEYMQISAESLSRQWQELEAAGGKKDV